MAFLLDLLVQSRYDRFMIRKNVFVTGASSGIGFELSKMLADKNYQVFALARREQKLKELQSYSSLIQPIVYDLCSDLQGLRKILENQEIDVLVNNAGLALGTEGIDQVKKEDWLTMFQTNVFSLIELTQMILPQMLERKSGDIVNMGSVAGFQTYKGGSIYNATKFAVRALTESFRKELLGLGIRVMGIHPGMVETEFSEVRFKGDKEKAKAVYSGMRPLSAKDIAEAVVWAIDRPSHVNIESMLIMPTDQAAVGHVHRDM